MNGQNNDKKNNGRPINECYELMNALAKKEVRKQTKPAINELYKAITKLEEITPLLEGIVKRQGGQAIWLLGLTITIVVLAVIVIDHL